MFNQIDAVKILVENVSQMFDVLIIFLRYFVFDLKLYRFLRTTEMWSSIGQLKSWKSLILTNFAQLNFVKRFLSAGLSVEHAGLARELCSDAGHHQRQ